MSLKISSTGWFGVPGRSPDRAKPIVHAVYRRQPICGCKLHHEAEYQFCGHGLHLDMIECQRCLETIRRDQYARIGCLDIYQDSKKIRETLNRIVGTLTRMEMALTCCLEKINARKKF